SDICRETMSWEVLNNTFLTKKTSSTRDIQVRMLPWTGELNEIEMTEFMSCGIFVCGTMLRDIRVFDNLVMTGSIFWIHDWIHTATRISANKVVLSSKSVSEMIKNVLKYIPISD